MQVSKYLGKKVSCMQICKFVGLHACYCIQELIYTGKTGRQMGRSRVCECMNAGIQVYRRAFSGIQACRCVGLQRRPGRQDAALWVK